jgi:hypothetical protein
MSLSVGDYGLEIISGNESWTSDRGWNRAGGEWLSRRKWVLGSVAEDPERSEGYQVPDSAPKARDEVLALGSGSLLLDSRVDL